MANAAPIAQDFAILAPVPKPILDSAEQDAETLVAFGSDKYAFWQNIPSDKFRVLIYESDRDDPLLAVPWEAIFEFWKDALEARGNPDLAKCRPSAAADDWVGFDRNEWAIWWFCSGLRRLDPPIELRKLMTSRGKPLSPAFIPRGPELILAPG